MSNLLIKNVQVSGVEGTQDIFIEEGKIANIDKKIDVTADQQIDATGLTLIPGMIDMHVHFRVPGGERAEDFFTGSAAAIAGGVTTVCDMPNTNPPIITRDLLNKKIVQAKQEGKIDILCYIGATNNNIKEIIASQDIACGVKVYYGTSTGNLTMNNPQVLEKLIAANLRIPIVLHAEDDRVIAENEKRFQGYNGKDIHSQIRSREAAVTALETILNIHARHPESKVHITHLSTKEELELIRHAKQRGMNITCDVTPHHLAFTTKDYERFGLLLRVNPPIREQEDVDALWQGIFDGTVDMIGSDHAPHLLAQKELSEYAAVPSGIPGVETSLLFLLDRLSTQLNLQRLIEITSTNAAKRFSLSGKGFIQVSAIADLVLVDRQQQTTIERQALKTKCGWSPWEGTTFRGSIIYVIKNGEVINQ
ncbi:MAG: dihydroorotase family protein [Candidatus Kerfeldbacteria bacterium]|nr:dihydroorotase family protein [Candidatus Kerfeldbacteria bacterium]